MRIYFLNLIFSNFQENIQKSLAKIKNSKINQAYFQALKKIKTKLIHFFGLKQGRSLTYNYHHQIFNFDTYSSIPYPEQLIKYSFLFNNVSDYYLENSAPNLKNLEILKIACFSNPNFLLHFPHLKILEILNSVIKEEKFIKIAKLLPQLKYLEVLGIKAHKEIISILPELKSLKKLKIHFPYEIYSKNKLDSIFENLSKLEKISSFSVHRFSLIPLEKFFTKMENLIEFNLIYDYEDKNQNCFSMVKNFPKIKKIVLINEDTHAGNEEILNLKNLSNITHLKLNVPEKHHLLVFDILPCLKNLEYLNLSFNSSIFKNFKDLVGAVLKMKKLKELNFSGKLILANDLLELEPIYDKLVGLALNIIQTDGEKAILNEQLKKIKNLRILGVYYFNFQNYYEIFSQLNLEILVLRFFQEESFDDFSFIYQNFKNLKHLYIVIDDYFSLSNFFLESVGLDDVNVYVTK